MILYRCSKGKNLLQGKEGNEMKEVKNIIERSTKELEQLKEKFNETPVEDQDKLRRLKERIDKLDYYIAGLNTALVYFEREVQ